MSVDVHRFGFEGLDGAGKSTQIARLIKDLQSLGLRVAMKTSPGKQTFSGTILRANIHKMDGEQANRLFRYDILRSQREKPFGAQAIIWDRHLDSVTVSNTEGAVINSTGIDPLNTIFYIQISPETSYAREQASSDHPIDAEWLRAKHDRYQSLIAANPEKYTIIDGDQSLDTVYAAIFAKVCAELAPIIEQQRKLHELILDTPGILRFVPDKPVEVKPDVFLPMFVNMKCAMENVPVRTEITNRMVDLVRDEHFDMVVGLESGGSYFAVSVANALNLPVTLFRTKEKNYSGATGCFVGSTPRPDSKVLLVDDVYATGQSGSRAVAKMAELGCYPKLITAYSYSSDNEMKARLGVEAASLTYFQGILSLVKERKVFSEEQLAVIEHLVDTYRATIFE